jgi:tetratricopeptide (TPR) repeat protein
MVVAARPASPHEGLAAGPDSPDFLKRAEALRRLGRRTEALALCRTGLARFPTFHSARALYGRLLLETGDVRGARVQLEGVIARVPGHLAAQRWLAEALDRAGEVDEAARVSQAAERLAPHDAPLRTAFERLLGPAGPRRVLPPAAADPAAASRESERPLLAESSPTGTTARLPAATSSGDAGDGLVPPSVAAAGPSGCTTSRPDVDAGNASARRPARDARIAALERWLAAVRRACPDTPPDTP